MVGKYNRDTSSVTATPSTVTSSSAAFGRWAFGIGQLRRDRRGRTGIVKGRSVRSGGNVLTTLSCSASGIFAICCDLTRPTITRLARTFQSTRTRRRREQYIPLVALCLRHSLADFIICMCEFDFRQAHAAGVGPPRASNVWRLRSYLARSFDWPVAAISVPELFRKEEALDGGKKWNSLSCYFSASSFRRGGWRA